MKNRWRSHLDHGKLRSRTQPDILGSRQSSPVYAGEAPPGDNLFTNSVIALNATTGKSAWHFQFTPHDEHDWDSNRTPVLADLVVDGVKRKVICWANRNGFYLSWIAPTENFCAVFRSWHSPGRAVLTTWDNRF